MCEWCIARWLHNKDIDFTFADIRFEDQIEIIIECFKYQIEARLDKGKIHILLLKLQKTDVVNGDD